MMQTNREIRPAKEADLTAIASLEAACFSLPMKKEHLVSALADQTFHRILVCQNDETLLGHLVLGLYPTLPPSADLLSIAVSPEARGGGIGEKMLKEAIALLQEMEVESLQLEVRLSNLPARRLYEKLGFCEIGRRKDYYDNPKEDAVLMELPLGGEKGCVFCANSGAGIQL